MWNKESIHKLLDENPKAVWKAVVVIYKLQTDAEKASDRTTEHNGVGFGAYDAEFLSDIARKVQLGWNMSAKQLAVTRNKMKRYHRQLAEIANAKIVVEPTIQAAEPDPEQAENDMVMTEINEKDERCRLENMRDMDQEFKRMRLKFERETGIGAASFS